jgi:hypothetical protein
MIRIAYLRSAAAKKFFSLGTVINEYGSPGQVHQVNRPGIDRALEIILDKEQRTKYRGRTLLRYPPPGGAGPERLCDLQRLPPDEFFWNCERRINGSYAAVARQNKSQFLDYLEGACNQMMIRIFAYCVMDNHYHLVLENSIGRMSNLSTNCLGLRAVYWVS